MDRKKPSLSVVVVVGDRRERAKRMVEVLALQSVVRQLEIIIVDAASDQASVLTAPPELQIKFVKVKRGILPGKARFEGTMRATAPIVAYLEDHCIPDQGWAEAVIESHQGPWVAVGYAFTNGSPDTYLYRSIFIAEYGHWLHPTVGGPTSRLPGSNVSYKRDILLLLGNQLADLLEMDYNLHESLRKRGLQFYIEPRALVAHECYFSFLESLYCHFCFSRLQAARRAKTFSWDVKRRIASSLVVPFALPPLQLLRAWKSLSTYKLLSTLIASIPLIYLIYQSEALGEAFGCLLGARNTDYSFALRELNSIRAGRM